MLWEVQVRVTAVEVGGTHECVRLLERGAEVESSVAVRGVDKGRLEDAVEGELDGLVAAVKEYLT